MMDRIHTTTNGNGNAASLAAGLSGEPIELTPQLGDSTARYMEFCRQVETETSSVNGTERIAATNQFRNDLIHNHVVKEEELALLFAKSVILDLVAQGWKLKVRTPKILVYPPAIENETKDTVKEIIRNTHLLGRDIQLNERSVQDFIKGMQRRRLMNNSSWHSIYSLMRDGEDLAQ